MIKRDKVLSMIGLAMRAGKVISGEFSVEKAVKSGKAVLVLVAGDASENTKKAFKDMCTFYDVPYGIYGTKETLGNAIGKEYRASIALLDRGFAGSVLKLINPES
ncbi:ribosomal protein L7Ae-like RNA K-turn-binding protein [Catenibacillus scindens]|uniref:Ribosomal protein L7Ae-like RNA K-turn-binding protein n=1 Tax=Catenibacillus scindens TaxID=673271 RepID=A0A7W8H7K9_9FIRM|nr:ribosomal protein L7Ae-like RNA K-turn-binding protein [Catenibacillus scindens]